MNARITCSKEIEPMLRKLILPHHFIKSLMTLSTNVFMDHERTYLPIINALACLKGIHTISKKVEIRPGTKECLPLEIILLVKPWNSIGKHIVQDYKFVRWRSTFHHVFVFTVNKRCVLFIYIIEYNL